MSDAEVLRVSVVCAGYTQVWSTWLLSDRVTGAQNNGTQHDPVAIVITPTWTQARTKSAGTQASKSTLFSYKVFSLDWV